MNQLTFTKKITTHRFFIMTPESFKKIPVVLEALKQPQSSRSILNYMCALIQLILKIDQN